MMTVEVYAITAASETQITFKCCLCKTSDFAGKLILSNSLNYHMCSYLFDTSFFLTEIITCSFNNNELKIRASGNAFYIMATVGARFFTTLI